MVLEAGKSKSMALASGKGFHASSLHGRKWTGGQARAEQKKGLDMSFYQEPTTVITDLLS